MIIVAYGVSFNSKVTGLSQGIDSRLIERIHSLVKDGVQSTKEMMRHLNIYVKEELLKGQALPASNNRRFYPKKKSVVNHMYLATIKQRYDKIDQSNVLKLVERWQRERPMDNFFFRQYASVKSSTEIEKDLDARFCNDFQRQEDESDDNEYEEDNMKIDIETSNQKLLFVHQTKDQARLLQMYGNEMTLLDATYKTTRYSLPLFFIVVKTNVDYQIVGSFATQDELTDSIAEPLAIIKSWCPSWNPKFFMVDNCAEEINAIERTFPGKWQTMSVSRYNMIYLI